MMRELVSVILPVFKANPDFLEQSIRSILSQTYDEIELVTVFDKCNPDVDNPSFAVLEQLHDDHRLRLIVNNSRLGLVSSLNEGIKLSKGDYIARMDCDDISSPTRIEEQMEMICSQKVDLVGCWAQVINEIGKTIGYLSPPSTWPMIRKHLLLHNPFLHPTILFCRQLTKFVGLYNPHFEASEDYEFILRAFSKGRTGVNLPRYLHSLREYASSVTRGDQWKRNRVALLKCKLAGVFEYHFNKAEDVVYLGITPLSLLVKPSKVLSVKKLFGLYKQSVSF